MKERYLPLINKSIIYLITALAFLLPVFYLPITTEYFEFNKLALTTLITSLLVILWGTKMLIESKVEITKSPLNVPILLILATYAISTYFSISKVSSIYGSYGRWNNSLTVIVVSTLLYFVIAANIRTKEDISNIITALIVGSSLSSIVAALSYFGIKIINAPYVQKNFTLTGSPIVAVVVAVVAFIIALNKFIDSKNTITKIIFGIVMLINILPIVLMGNFATWALFVVSLICTITLSSMEKLKQSSTLLYIIFGIIILAGISFSVPSIRKELNIPTYPQELKLDLGSSWSVTTSALRDFPLFGSGPSTFYLNFPHYRPLGLNATGQWNVKFDKPFNEILDITATLGIVGLLIYIWFVYKTIKFVKHTDHSEISVALNSLVLGMLAFSLLSYSTVLTNVLLLMFLGLITAYLQSTSNASSIIIDTLVETAVISFAITGRSTNITTKTVAIMFSIPMFALTALGTFFGLRAYGAEIMMRNGIIAAIQNNGASLYNAQRTAINLNPYIDAYHTSFAQTNYLLANALAESKKAENLTDEDKKNIQNLIASAIQETRITTEILNPTNPAMWEQRAHLYSQLKGIAKDADSWAVGAYTRAIELDPTNPVLRVNLGGIYYSANDFATAERHFRAAVSLKPDYANGHYNLAQALKQEKKYPEALTEMQIVLRLVPEDSEDFKLANAELASLKGIPEVAGAETSKPSVADLQQKANNTNEQTTEQEPLKSPAEKEKPTIKESTPSSNPDNK